MRPVSSLSMHRLRSHWLLALVIPFVSLPLAGCGGSAEPPGEGRDAEDSPQAAETKIPAPFRDLERFGAHVFRTTDGISVYLHDPARGDADVQRVLQAVAQQPEFVVLRLARTSITDGSLADVGKLTQLKELDLAATPITDQGLAQLDGLVHLKRLDLEATPITDAGLPALAALSELEWLSLARTKITGAGLKHLASLTRLKHLDLGETSFGDDDVSQLAPLEKLVRLRAFETSLSPEGVAALRREHPQLLVVQ